MKQRQSDLAERLGCKLGAFGTPSRIEVARGQNAFRLRLFKDLFATSKPGYPYDPEAKCEKFRKFIDRFTCGREEVQTLIGEIFAYCLMRRLNFQKLFIFVGPGSNGKSVLLHVLRHLVGPDACSAIPIERLGGRFTLSDMLACRLNIAGDMNTTSRAAEGTLKMLCDGSAMQSEAKFKPSYTVESLTRLLFATNVMLKILDPSDGVWRRIIAILCDARITPEQRANQYETVLCEELPGSLNWVLSLAPASIERGSFTEPECCRELLQQERTNANSVANWFENCVIVDGETFAGSTKMLYDHYIEWTAARKYIPKASGNFRTDFKRLLKADEDAGVVKYTRGKVLPGGLVPGDIKTMGKTIRGWKGLRVLPSLDDGRDDEAERPEECDHDWLAENVNEKSIDAPAVHGGTFTRRTCKLCGDVAFVHRRAKAIAADRREGPRFAMGTGQSAISDEQLLERLGDGD